MTMKMKLTVAACAIISGSFFAHAGGEGWSHDFAASSKKAASEKKDMLVDFTGSDWCGWCIKLNKEGFSHDEFKDGVKDGYVLVEVDYPKDKSKLSKETIAQNEGLKGKYSVRGYPTILLMDGEGKPFAKTGYRPGGPSEYVTHLKELSEVRAGRDKAFAEAAEAKGVEKAKLLVGALKAMSLDDTLLASFYSDKIDEIKAADPGDESGFVKGIEQKKKYAKFQDGLNSLASGGKFKEALELVETTVSSGDYEGEMLQQVVMIKGMVHAQLEEMDKAMEALDKAIAIAPESQASARIASIKEQIAKKMAEAEKKEDRSGE